MKSNLLCMCLFDLYLISLLDFEVNKISQLQFKKMHDSLITYSPGENQFLYMQIQVGLSHENVKLWHPWCRQFFQITLLGMPQLKSSAFSATEACFN
jgi:hypothetical protein